MPYKEIHRGQSEKPAVDADPLRRLKPSAGAWRGDAVMDQATGYNVFATGGLGGTRHAISQLLTHSGEVFYELTKAEMPTKLLRSYTGTRFVFEGSGA